MPEGPSIILLKESLLPFIGKTVTSAGGYTPMPTRWLPRHKLLGLDTWGKHLLMCFAKGTVRIHLQLFGSVSINMRRKVNPSLYLRFGKQEINFYVVHASKLDDALTDIYDWRTDIMSPKWSSRRVLKLMEAHGEDFIGDLLMNQEVFSGVGNIIRNEVLFRSRLHPLSIVGKIPAKKKAELLKRVRAYGKEFLHQKREGTLSAHLLAYKREVCPRDGTKLTMNMPGKAKRKTYYCKRCQLKYD